jgi:hypothetical protein
MQSIAHFETPLQQGDFKLKPDKGLFLKWLMAEASAQMPSICRRIGIRALLSWSSRAITANFLHRYKDQNNTSIEPDSILAADLRTH